MHHRIQPSSPETLSSPAPNPVRELHRIADPARHPRAVVPLLFPRQLDGRNQASAQVDEFPGAPFFASSAGMAEEYRPLLSLPAKADISYAISSGHIMRY